MYLKRLLQNEDYSFAKTLGKDKTILVNLSGRGDKDIDFVVENYPVPHAKF